MKKARRSAGPSCKSCLGPEPRDACLLRDDSDFALEAAAGSRASGDVLNVLDGALAALNFLLLADLIGDRVARLGCDLSDDRFELLALERHDLLRPRVGSEGSRRAVAGVRDADLGRGGRTLRNGHAGDVLRAARCVVLHAGNHSITLLASRRYRLSGSGGHRIPEAAGTTRENANSDCRSKR